LAALNGIFASDKPSNEVKKHQVEVRDTSGRLRENRVLFDEDIHWALSRESADRILDRVKKAGFNVYVPCVWHGGGSFFPSRISSLDPRLKRLVDSGYDPLRYLIKRAHEIGIEVHPWVTVVRRETNLYPQFHDNGTPQDAFNVHNPEFCGFIIKMMTDLVARYDVDGVNLDYIRSMGICTSTFCKKDYSSKLKYDFDDDFTRISVAGPARDRLQQWQDDAVSSIVRVFSKKARELKPGIVISVDGNPTLRGEHRPLEGRNEIYWANQGWIDVIYNMDYGRKIDTKAVNETLRLLTAKAKLIEIFGNYDVIDGNTVSRSGKVVADYATLAQRKWPDSGIAFYIYDKMDDEQIRELRTGPFRETALTNWR
jgi:uncharacterized lipoprotein YddW (UPF0748 family)